MTALAPPVPPVWRVAGMRELAALCLFGFTGFMVLLPVAPLWAVHGGADTAGAGLVNGVMLAFTVLSQVLVPRALARFGWTPVLACGLVLLGAPSLVMLTSDALGVVLAISAVRGLGFGMLTVTGSSAVVRLVEPGRRGAAIGFYGLAIALPNLVMLPIGPWLAQHVGYWLVFALGALPLLGVGAAARLARQIAARRPREGRPDAEGAETPGESVWAVRRRLARPTLLLLSVTITGGALITFLPQMVSTGWLAAVALFVMGLLAAGGRWRVGALADRHGARRFLWPLLALTSAGTVLVAWSVADPSATRAWALLAGVAIAGLGYGALQNLTLVVAFGVVSRTHHDTASSTWNIGFDAGTGLGSVAAGAIAATTSFAGAMLAAAAVTVIAIPLAVTRGTVPENGRPKRRRRGRCDERS